MKFNQLSTCDYKKRPCQIGIMLSVRVRVGFRVLSPIKKTNLLVKFSYIIPMFRDSEFFLLYFN